VRHEKFLKKGQLHSDGKLEIFYKSVMLALFLTAVLLACLGGVSFDHELNWKWWDFTSPV
jgi:hypothetical protein